MLELVRLRGRHQYLAEVWSRHYPGRAIRICFLYCMVQLGKNYLHGRSYGSLEVPGCFFCLPGLTFWIHCHVFGFLAYIFLKGLQCISIWTLSSQRKYRCWNNHLSLKKSFIIRQNYLRSFSPHQAQIRKSSIQLLRARYQRENRFKEPAHTSRKQST